MAGQEQHTQGIADKAITLPKLADLAANSIIGNNTGAAATPIALTVAQVQAILELDSAAYTPSSDYAPVAEGVTNGDGHDHLGGDGAQIAYGGLSGLPTIPVAPIVDTRANILALSPAVIRLALASDTLDLYIADGTNWRRQDLKFVADLQSPDMGFTTDSPPHGYGSNTITDKTINNFVIGSNGNPVNGGVRVTTAGVFQIYLSGSWNTVDVNFVFREDTGNGYTFEHQPVGFMDYIEIMTGMGLSNLGLNGIPLTNAYKTNMGAYGSPGIIGGRSIT